MGPDQFGPLGPTGAAAEALKALSASGVEGHQTKMSASVESTALYMTDTPKKLRNLVRTL